MVMNKIYEKSERLKVTDRSPKYIVNNCWYMTGVNRQLELGTVFYRNGGAS